jgi:DNA processing protein
MPTAAPPLDGESTLADLRLACVAGAGPLARKALPARFGSAAAVFAAADRDLREVAGVGPKLAAAIAAMSESDAPARVLELCVDRGVAVLPQAHSSYPSLLARIHDPPGILFARGDLRPCDALAIAIVGSRHATAYGRRMAWQLAGSLARAGFTIVSGLARGIDAAAHRGALDAGGRTIAVLGSGVLAVYPPEHDDLAAEVAAHGAVVSEPPPLAPPVRGGFPQRNRIVSGLALGTIVVEAADRSGALITARLAGEQGREVFAVPGAADSRMSRGCHRLIRDGARLVETADDVLDELGPLFQTATSAAGRTVRVPAELQLDDVERLVVDAVDAGGGEPVSIDGVVETTGLAASRVLATIGVLEMRRILRRLPGGRVGRA